MLLISSKNTILVIAWILMNIIGFTVGSILGATNGGIIQGIPGDLVFGCMIGIAQWVILAWRHPTQKWNLALWIFASAIGFTIGVRAGARLSFMITSDQFLLVVVFGLVVGTFVGLAHWAILRWAVPYLRQIALWIPVSIVAWVIGEGVASSFEFMNAGTPYVGLSIGAVTGVALLFIHKEAGK